MWPNAEYQKWRFRGGHQALGDQELSSVIRFSNALTFLVIGMTILIAVYAIAFRLLAYKNGF
jgi:hypothetical protein